MIPVALGLLCMLGADGPVKPADTGLATIRRIYVAGLTGGPSALQVRDMIIGALQSGGLYTITENEERADAVLRGTAEDTPYTDRFSSSENVGTRSNSGDRTRTTKTAAGGSRYNGLSINDSESSHIEERRHEAMASVRLVNKDGDVIWSTTQESRGAKLLSAGADVAAKVAKQLATDTDRARKASRQP
jgi:hypothetical protein